MGKHRREEIRRVAFPLADAYDPRDIVIAEILGLDVADLIEQRERDDIPDFWPLAMEPPATQQESNVSEQPTEKVLADGEDAVRKAIGNSRWLKFDSGQVRELNIIGEPQLIEKTFPDSVQERVKVSAFVLADATIKTWEMPTGLWREIDDEKKDVRGADSPDAVFKVKRDGAGKTTKWRARYLRALTSAEAEARATALGGDQAAPEPDMPF